MAHIAPCWSLYLLDHSFRRLFHKAEKLFGASVRPGMTVLDLGCGHGFFTIDMARMVGPEGRVIAVDVQQNNLDIVRRRADRAGLAERVRTVRCAPDEIGVDEQADFGLAFWVVHETPDVAAFFRQVRACLKDESHLLMAEPIFHVKRAHFEESVRLAESVGWKLCSRPDVRFSKAALFKAVEDDAGQGH
ncbi:MAG: methyltransferase domain-containing protein [Anaerolineaceae bacterium]|nr:methyltransferase domain-containing protein [Anaerolineaceae bacterium]